MEKDPYQFLKPWERANKRVLIARLQITSYKEAFPRTCFRSHSCILRSLGGLAEQRDALTVWRALILLWGRELGPGMPSAVFCVFFWVSLSPPWIKKDTISSLSSPQISLPSSIYCSISPFPSGWVSLSGGNIHLADSRKSCHLPLIFWSTWAMATALLQGNRNSVVIYRSVLEGFLFRSLANDWKFLLYTMVYGLQTLKHTFKVWDHLKAQSLCLIS